MIWLHVLAGALALIAGAVAMFAVKGGTLHRRSGMAFAVAMLVMTCSAVVIAAFLRSNPMNVVAGTLTFYLVCTGVLTVRRSVEQSRRLATGFMLLALTGSASAFALAFVALGSADGRVQGMPASPFILFGVIGLVGGLLDARMLRARSLLGAHRLARHLWRMGLAMWIATASFFFGQADLFSEPVRKSGVLAIPVLLVLGFLLYWLLRVLWKRKHAVSVRLQ